MHDSRVLDQMKKEDAKRLEALKKSAIVTTRPFESAKEELLEFLSKHDGLPSEPNELLKLTVERLVQLSPNVPSDEIEDAFGMITTHFAHMLKRARDLINTLEKDSRWIHVPEVNTVALYGGVALHRLLAETRLLGIVPENAIEALRSLKIGSIGASVASGSMDLLVSLGVEHLHFYDEGVLSPSNEPRMPHGHFLDNGRPKVEVVSEQLRGRNPYGDFQGVFGKVVPTEGEKKGEHDISFEVFASRFDIFLEVADSPHIKAGFREFLAKNHPTKPMFYIADVGSNPFSNVEIPAHANFFGQGIDAQALHALSEPVQSLVDALSRVRRMVGVDFPTDHLAQFALARVGENAYWSQTPIAMRESAAVTAKLLVLYLSSSAITNKNVHANETPTSLYPYSEAQLETIRKIDAALFPAS